MTDPLLDESGRRAEAAEYVLRLLNLKEEQAFEDRLSTDRRLEREVAEWVAYFAPLSDSVAPIAPPKSVFDRLQTDLFGAPPEPSLWNRITVWRPLALAAMACAALLAVLVLLQSPEPVPPSAPAAAQYVGEIVSDDQALRVLLTYEVGSGTLRLTRTDGAPREGRDLELWAVLADGTPRSLGLLSDARGSTLAIAQELRASVPSTTLAISDEPDGGSTTGLPTGPVLALGGLTDL